MKPIIFLTLISLFSCQIEDSYPKADWTILFYIADDTYQPISLINDIEEITKNEVNTSDMRVIILYDGPDVGDSSLVIIDSPFTMNYRTLDVSNAGLDTESEDELDMSNQDTLSNFISYVKKVAPADNYALYFGSHGTGYTESSPGGLQVESNDNKDIFLLTTIEIAEATKNDNFMNLICFDVCNQGNIETVYELKNSTEYIIASPEEIPVNGNDYTSFITAALMLENFTAYELGVKTLEIYYNYYNINPGSFNGHEHKSLQQLYDVNKIYEIVQSSSFKSSLSTLYADNSGATKFLNDKGNYISYTNLLEIINLTDFGFDSAITIADGGIYKWISIYMPTIPTNHNPLYNETKFAIETNWLQ